MKIHNFLRHLSSVCYLYDFYDLCVLWFFFESVISYDVFCVFLLEQTMSVPFFYILF